MSASIPPAVDLAARHAAIVLGASLPGDVLLYLLLPMYAGQFGVSVTEAGVLLAANRLVRIAGYGAVNRFYAAHGDRATCSLAAIATAVCGLGYAVLSGFWALLPLRLLWGLSFAALNLSTQATATAHPAGSAKRSGRSRAIVAIGPVLALPAGALIADRLGPRPFFVALAVVALASLFAARKLPALSLPGPSRHRRWRRPGSLDMWSFCEGFTLDGLFVVGLSYLGQDVLPGNAVIAAGLVLALRYLVEIFLAPMGGSLAERFGAERLLVILSLLTCVTLVGFGSGWIWSCGSLIVVLRALQLPLLSPIVAIRTPGPERIQALANRAVWRDIGAGIGPIAAGLLLPLISTIWIYSASAAFLAAAALSCVRRPVAISSSPVATLSDE